MRRIVRTGILIGLAFALTAPGVGYQRRTIAAAPAATVQPASAPVAGRIVSMRRLTEAQYRNTIADVFGGDIKVSGRFEPILRPAHQLLSAAASKASISPTGLEQFDAVGRGIAAQVFGEDGRVVYVPCTPRNAEQADSACAEKALAPIGRMLFRRPLTRSEIVDYMGIADRSAAQSSSFYYGLEMALSAMLVSPNFLYVIENAEPDPARPGEWRLDGYSRAARLSFLLWNTTPGEDLLAAAADGRLADEGQMAAVAQKMIDSPRFSDGVRAFFSDMLMFEMFDDLSKDSVVYPRFNQTVANAMPEQLLRTIVDLLVTRDGDYRELFTTRRTFLTRALGPLYGVPVPQSQGWMPYEFAQDDQRSGILTLAGFLSLGEAQTGRSSPTIRGRAIRELLLCQPVPDPPGNVDFKAVQETGNLAMPTARQRLEVHSTNPVCAGCHRITDPIGLSLENFDGIGAFRARENDAVIDASAAVDGSNLAGAVGLGKFLAAQTSTTQCVAQRAVEYAAGRTDEADAPFVERIGKAFAADGYRLRALFLRVATAPEAYRVSSGVIGGAPAKVAALKLPTRRQGARP